MTPPQSRQQITELFESALRQAPDQRREFLRSACAGDEAVFAEVSSLVAEYEQLGDSMGAAPIAKQFSATPNAPSGRQIGRYQVVRELGRGAMGVVFEARDPLIGRTVALKTIRLDSVGTSGERAWLQERLFREARSAGALSHPGIVVIYDLGMHQDLAYIAMEYVDGSTLEKILATPPRPTTIQMVDIIRQAAAALDHACKSGVVHRDVKPANIMLQHGKTVKITDFGIAKITTTQQITRTGMTMGTPSYMSPEQITAQALDGRADQFSLTVVAYEMLTGEKPFPGESLPTLVHQIVYEERPSAFRANSALPEAVDAVFYRGLAKLPTERFRSSGEMAEALTQVLQEKCSRDAFTAQFAAEMQSKRQDEERAERLRRGAAEVEKLLAGEDWEGATPVLQLLCEEFQADRRLLELGVRLESIRHEALARKESEERRVLLERQAAEAIETERREYEAGLQQTIVRAKELLSNNLPGEAMSCVESASALYGHEGAFTSLFATVIQATKLEDERRLAEELRIREADRKAREVAQREAEIERRRADEARIASQSEADWRASEQAQAARVAEEQRLAEEAAEQEHSRTARTEESPTTSAQPTYEISPDRKSQPKKATSRRVTIAALISLVLIGAVAVRVYEKTTLKSPVESRQPMTITPTGPSVTPAPSNLPVAQVEQTRPTGGEPQISSSQPLRPQSASEHVNPPASSSQLPVGEHASAATEDPESAEWTRLQTGHDVSPIQEFLRRYPNTIHRGDALHRVEQIEWEALQSEREPSYWRSFLARHPSSEFSRRVNDKIEELEWDQLNRSDVSALQAFLQEHPGGPHSALARVAIDQAKAAMEHASILDALRRYTTAIERKDENQLREAWPGISQSALDQWRLDFRNTLSIKMQLLADPVSSVSGQTARTDCRYRTEKSFVGDSQTYSSERTSHIALRKSNGRWVIESVR